MSDYLFDHEKLHVYQKALLFVVWLKEAMPGKKMLNEIVSMLVGLIKSNSDRVHDVSEEYD